MRKKPVDLALTAPELLALQLAQRGRGVLVVDRHDQAVQPEDIRKAIDILPSLAVRGFMFREDLTHWKAMYRITELGRQARAAQRSKPT